MKNRSIRIISIILVLFSIAAVLPANEVSAVWIRLFRRATTLSQKSNIMANIVELHDRDMIPVLMEALEEQVGELENSGNVTDRLKTVDYIKMVVKELG